jgi:GNAT superfamily N-acetyltransferase
VSGPGGARVRAAARVQARDDLHIHAVTPDRWGDLVELFGERGASSGCWCMWYRQSAREYEERSGEGNRRALKALVDGRGAPGLLAYLGSEPVGWVSVAPRVEFERLERSRVLGPVDGRRVWSVVCFYIHRRHRGTGVSRALLDAAIGFARDQGARVVEAYPKDPGEGTIANAEAFTGVPSLFEAAGFREVARRSPTRPIMRRAVRPPSASSRHRAAGP